jgi:hypothetical protein
VDDVEHGVHFGAITPGVRHHEHGRRVSMMIVS